MSMCGEASSSVLLPVQAPSALILLGFTCLLCSSVYLASAFCHVVTSALNMLSPLVRMEGPPCRPPTSHPLISSTVVSWQALRAASANTLSPKARGHQRKQASPNLTCLACPPTVLPFLGETALPLALFDCLLYAVCTPTTEISIHAILFGVHKYPVMAGCSIHLVFADILCLHLV